jgi:hypothetical protein
MLLTLNIPTLINTTDLESLFCLYQEALNSEVTNMVLDFSDCLFLRHDTVAFLGGLVRCNQRKGKTVRIHWGSVRENVCINLKQNGFYQTHTDDWEDCACNSILYREEQGLNTDGFVKYFQEEVLEKIYVNIICEYR